MRLIRLSAKDESFPNLEAVHFYFQNPDSPFRNRGEFATFLCDAQIGSDRLQPGETLLFSYCVPGEKARVVYVASAWTGRESWTGAERGEYPYCFRVNIATLREVSFTVRELEGALGIRLPASQGWPILPDGIEAEWALNTLCRVGWYRE